MKLLKHSVYVAVWLSASWPCMHAVAAAEHGHDHAAGIDMCASSDQGCHCHGCREVPCSDKTAEVVQRLSWDNPIGLQPSYIPLFTPSDYRPAQVFVRPDNTAVLKALQTVRLLT